MHIDLIRDHYAQMETKALIKLLSEITSLTHEAILALQKELLDRGEKEYVIKITEYLASPRFQVPEEKIIKYMLVLRKRGLNNSEIDKELRDSFGIDQDYVEYAKSSIKSKGKENLFIGIVLTIIPLAMIVLSIIMGGFIGIGAAIILGFGVWRLILAIKLLKNPKN